MPNPYFCGEILTSTCPTLKNLKFILFLNAAFHLQVLVFAMSENKEMLHLV